VSLLSPAREILTFDVFELAGPSQSGRVWASDDDWALFVNTTEDQAARTLVANIETFRHVGESYRHDREAHGAPIERSP
jgi:hypothetical protein